MVEKKKLGANSFLEGINYNILPIEEGNGSKWREMGTKVKGQRGFMGGTAQLGRR